MSAAISIQGLSKRFRKAASMAPYRSLRDAVADGLKRGWRREQTEDFWALRDVNLDIQQGERFGIIGRNGAGKSTLLKILSRISPPTSGRIILEGRVASLLEVGTGFHPELTGRENIYLNGSILGLKRTEINDRLDEIIDFSGVSAFIDSPLKHYSSGMQLRLAFSVAAHLEPEILLIDEVLAVGDIEFQQRCLGKMEEVSQQKGRTILFVSHNLEAVLRLCDKAVWLKAGEVEMVDEASKVLSAYVADSRQTAQGFWGTNDESIDVCILEGRVETAHPLDNTVRNGEPLNVTMKIQVNRPRRFSFELLIRDSKAEPLLFLPAGLAHEKEHFLQPGTYTVTISTPLPFLAKDSYSIDLVTADTNKGYIHYLESALSFEMEGKVWEATNFEYNTNQRMGKILLTQPVTVHIA